MDGASKFCADCGAAQPPLAGVDDRGDDRELGDLLEAMPAAVAGVAELGDLMVDV